MRMILATLMIGIASTALAQDEPAEVPELVGGSVRSAQAIAVPVMPSGDSTGRQISEVIAADLRATGLFTPLGPGGMPGYSESEAGNPNFPSWRNVGASALVAGYVEPRADGRITVACYLHDVTAGRQLAQQGFAVDPSDWRRAAHKCADLVYSRLSGQQPFLDTKVVYVAETGPKNDRVKRVAIMDSDGSNHRYLTVGRNTVVTPRFSPRGDKLVYTAYIGRRPRVLLYDVASGQERLLIPGNHITFAPRFSPDGRDVIFSMADGGNTDIFIVSANGGPPRRLTATPGADTSPSFSPDGRQIVFESDRSGSQQLYVMNRDGSGQRRISFGGGRYASPVWSPTGNMIAFTKIAGAFRIGVMQAGGGGEKILTDGWQDEGPSWAPNGQFVMFHRTQQGSGAARLYAVPVNGGRTRMMPTPVGGSDPSWSPLND
ncbi:Tol-Pal system beta propeller repeat protein TolB [Sphingomonas xanthus]|uniref:Tol-Pal system protein TolB n=1 Tax=Sphingomonas xanthus TaxID=2594473 RepID=A0A516IQX0_9SPHN|nr:Tol-Pal system beta propeller repeat protein TolB [Sphingomonas xanthus]QDP19318.1 Tol-Pal system protein TolB [Sphingomonas xanthus]